MVATVPNICIVLVQTRQTRPITQPRQLIIIVLIKVRSGFKLRDKMKNLLPHAFSLFDEKKNNSEWNQMS